MVFLQFSQRYPLLFTPSACFFLMWFFKLSFLVKVLGQNGQVTRCSDVPQRFTWRWKWVECLIKTPHLGHFLKAIVKVKTWRCKLRDVNSLTIWNEMKSALGPFFYTFILKPVLTGFMISMKFWKMYQAIDQLEFSMTIINSKMLCFTTS